MNIYLGLSAAPPPTVDRQPTPASPSSLPLPALKQVVRLRFRRRRRRLHLCRTGARFRTMRHSGNRRGLPSPAAFDSPDQRSERPTVPDSRSQETKYSLNLHFADLQPSLFTVFK